MNPSPPVNPFDELRQELDILPAASPKPVNRQRSFISVVDTVFHQRSAGSQPVSVPSRYNHELTTSEQAYSRELIVTGEWKPLDHGWLERGFMLKLRNREGTNLTEQPGEAGWDDIRSRVVELGVRVVATDEGRRTQWSAPKPEAPIVLLTFVRPGTDVRIQPTDLGQLVIRCRNQTARCLLDIIPE